MERTGKGSTSKSETTKSAKSAQSPAGAFSYSGTHPGSHSMVQNPGGKVTEYIEDATGKMPWVSWVGLAALSVGASVFLAATPRARGFAACAGALGPCFLMMGIYNKLNRFERLEIQQHLKLMEPHVEVPSPTSYLS